VFQRPSDAVALAVDLVNTWDELEKQPELLRDVAALQGFLERRGYQDEAQRVTGRDVVAAHNLRGRLRVAFEVEGEETAVECLNAILSGSDAKPQVERAGDRWRVRWVGSAVDVLASTAAMSLLEAIRDDGWERFGICAGAPCCCVFVDRSRNLSRRFCSNLCADRVAQAAYRLRRRRQRSGYRRADR
jgi:predicted RNA-binding Zn ribbon-like protein